MAITPVAIGLAAGAGAVSKAVLRDGVVRGYNYKYRDEDIAGGEEILARERDVGEESPEGVVRASVCRVTFKALPSGPQFL